MTDIFLKFGYDKTIIKTDLEIENLGQLYSFANPLDMPIGRFQAFQDAATEMQYGATKELILKSLDRIEDAANKGRLSEIGMHLFILRDAINITPSYHFYKVASLCLLCENENPNYFDFDLSEKKIEAFSKLTDDKKKALLNIIITIFKELGMTSLSDIQTFSEALDKADRQLKKYEKIVSTH